MNMDSTPAAVAQIGICTSLGYSVPAIDAAVRGGITMFVETPWFGRHGEPLRAAAAHQMSWDMSRARRMQEMTAAALDTDWAFVDADQPDPRVFLAAPNLSLARSVLDAMQPLLSDVHSSAQVFSQGRSAFFYALSAALAALRAGGISSALVGGVDSLCTYEILKELDNGQRLLGSAPRGGLVPGEGAAFILLVSGLSHRCLERQAPQGIVLAAASDVERHHFL